MKAYEGKERTMESNEKLKAQNEQEEKEQNEKRRIMIIIILIIIILISMYMGYFLGKIIEPILENIDSSEDGNSSVTQNNNIVEDSNNKDTEEIETTVYYVELTEVNAHGEFVKTNADVLDIFNFSSLYIKNGKIAPTSTGAYNFYITNKNNFKIEYTLSLEESSNLDINVKYRIKINGTYASEEWSSLEELSYVHLELGSNTSTYYSLEWQWFNSENDTIIGLTGGTYKLNLSVYATEI